MRIVFIGSGNLATQLSAALQRGGEDIVQVYSRTMRHAEALAQKLRCQPCAALDDIRTDADIYIFSVSDDALPMLISALAPRIPSRAVALHTAGSVPMSVFAGSGINHYGVLYPMQTFSKDRDVDFSPIPCFVEGADDKTIGTIQRLAGSVSGHVLMASSEKRKKLHLAAVFACNMVNHCYRLAEKILQEEDIDFSLYLPLIQETADKVSRLSPRDAQTGPMARRDLSIMKAQISMLHDERTREIYRLMAESIHEDRLSAGK